MLKKIAKYLRRGEGVTKKKAHQAGVKLMSDRLSVVSPMYNVGLYLDDFLNSLVSQTTGLSNVEIILVDDGSTDNTAEIAVAWQARYPANIRYFRQENAGAAEARNTGLALASGKWIIFPDPDDFLSPNFFEVINDEVRRHHPQPLLMISLNMLFYLEAENKTRDGHPLRHRFKSGRTELNSWEIDDHIQMSAATACFDRHAIIHHGIRFDGRVRATFEDGHFVNRLLLAEPRRSVVFTSAATYYYRKRQNLTSALDGSHGNPAWFTSQLRYGYLDLIKRSLRQWAFVPKFIQVTILYDIFWRFRTLLGNEHRASVLSEAQVSEFISLLHELFNHIDEDTIRTQSIGGLHEEHKIALLGMFKDATPKQATVYLRQVDFVERRLQFSFYAAKDQKIEICVNGNLADAALISRRQVTFFTQNYFTETRFWIACSPSDKLEVFVDEKRSLWKIGSKVIGEELTVWEGARRLTPIPQAEARKNGDARRLRNFATSLECRSQYARCWILMDRDDSADDNAEHLYRYIKRTNSDINSFFVLRRDSPDWQRLADEGFNLLDFGSKQHLAALINAEFLISSHADDFILWPASSAWLKDLVTYKYVFLQHGVIHNDLSHWLNQKPIRMLVTSSTREYDAISGISGNYLLTEREVRLVGMPRHDALLATPSETESLVFMPTWRRSLMGATVGSGMARNKSEHFKSSVFCQSWSALLKDKRLHQLAKDHGKRLLFCPHPNLAIYAAEFEVPEYFEVLSSLPIGYQQVLKSCHTLITDFSSIAFDAAYLNRPVVYFQFDRDEFFSDGHFFKKGYFDFDDDGFGPVRSDKSGVIRAIANSLSGQEDDVYETRRSAAFPFRDGKCSERVLDNILALRRCLASDLN